MPPFTWPLTRLAEVAKSAKFSCPTTRSKVARSWSTRFGVQVRATRGLGKLKPADWELSPDWVRDEVSTRPPASSCRVGRSRQDATAKASNRCSSTRMLAEGRATGTPSWA